MDSYLMMLYVTLEQESAMKILFMDQGWAFCKPDLSVTTDKLGPAIGGIPTDNQGNGSSSGLKNKRKSKSSLNNAPVIKQAKIVPVASATMSKKQTVSLKNADTQNDGINEASNACTSPVNISTIVEEEGGRKILIKVETTDRDYEDNDDVNADDDDMNADDDDTDVDYSFDEIEDRETGAELDVSEASENKDSKTGVIPKVQYYQEAYEAEPKQEDIAGPSTGRFKHKDTSEIDKMEEANQAQKTKENTKWAVKILEDWYRSMYGSGIDIANIEKEELCIILRRFYCEASPKESAVRTKKLGNSAKLYRKNTLKNIRSGVNRHLSDIGRDIDIVNDVAFKSANRTLKGCLKEQTRSGTSRPNERTIEPTDLMKIAEYFTKAEGNPIILRLSVWFNLGLHFVSHGLEFHHKLQVDSFDFQIDSDGREFVTLNHEAQQKYFQGGVTNDEAPTDRHMYATGLPNCPIKLLKLLISRTDESATSLFNACVKDALLCPGMFDIWFANSPLAKRTYSGFMGDICKAAGTSGWYTPHCVRATGITT